jgi:hypothetical protein
MLYLYDSLISASFLVLLRRSILADILRGTISERFR